MSDLSLIPEAAWREAQRRAEVIRLAWCMDRAVVVKGRVT